MSHEWSYTPLWDAISHFEYPDDFVFGSVANDSPVFDQAWAFMLTHNMPVVHFPGYVDPEALEEASAVLLRTKLWPNNVAYISVGVALARLTEADNEAIFATDADAHAAAMLFGGTVLSGQDGR